MGPYSPEPVNELKVEHLEKNRQNCQEPGADSDPPRQAQVRVNFTQKGPRKKQVTGKVTG
jgi:hypothetical protein